MAASLCLRTCGSSTLALQSGSQALKLRTQDAPFSTPFPARPSRRGARVACVRAQNGGEDEGSAPRRAGLTSLLLPSVAALIVGGTTLVPEAQAEMSQAEYYKSLMESLKKTNDAPPPVLTAPSPSVQAPPTVPVKAAATTEDSIDFSSLFSSALTDTKPKSGDAPQAEEQPKAPSASELRIKKAEEVARKQREEAEKRAAEEKAQQEAKAQAENRAKEARERAEKEAEEARKRAADRLKPKQAPQAQAGKKTHGFLPLFITQFLFLGLYAGAITLAFFLPDSQTKELKTQANQLFEKITPLLEQAKPLADKAVVAGSNLARQAQPYVKKAAQQAVPLAKKAVDSAKPLVSQAQAKAGEAIDKIKEEQKV